MLPFPLVFVEWADHWSDSKWVNPKDIDHKPELCLTVGWVVKEDDKGLTLASCIDPKDPVNGAMGSTQYVVKSCITKQVIIRKAKQPKIKA